MRIVNSTDKHTQGKYQSGQIDNNRYFAILAGIVVVEADIDADIVTFRHAGQHTLTTIKAMNGALKDLGIQNYFKVLIKKGKLFLYNRYMGNEVELVDGMCVDASRSGD